MASKGSIREQGLIVDNFPVYRVSEHEFHEQMVQFFRPYMYRAILNSQMDWDSLVHASWHFAQYLQHPELRSVSFEFVFGLFEDLFFVDQDIVMSLLTDYTKRRLESYGFRLTDSKVYVYLRERGDHKFRNIQVPRYQYIMLPCVLQKLFDKPFVFQDLEFVKRVLRYVAPMKLTSEDLSDYVKSMFKRMRKDATLKRVVDIKDPLIYCSRYSVVRLKLILMSIDFVVCCRRARQRVRQNSTNSINSIDSLKLFFEAIPEALVTVQDVKDVLKFFIRNVNEEIEEILNDFYHSFKVEFPESEQPCQPRSLAHYSRCEIRKSLHLFSTIPHGVKRLGLPKTLQNYVLFQKRAFEFHPRFNVFSRERKFEVRGMR